MLNCASYNQCILFAFVIAIIFSILLSVGVSFSLSIFMGPYIEEQCISKFKAIIFEIDYMLLNNGIVILDDKDLKDKIRDYYTYEHSSQCHKFIDDSLYDKYEQYLPVLSPLK